MISYEQALNILQQNEKQPSIDIATDKALGFVAVKAIKSDVFVPPFNNSAMDGFAIKSADIANASKESPISLKIAGSTMAGDSPSSGATGAWEIMTGAPVPENYDSVVKIEDIDLSKKGFATFSNPIKIHNNIRDRGEDFSPNDLIIEEGTIITAKHIMALAAIGVDRINVATKPNIKIFSTGKEIINNSKTPLLKGQIRNSNSPYLKAILSELGLNSTYGGVIPDNAELFEEKIRQAIKDNDIIISTGAVSMGKKDFVPDSLRKLGADIIFHKVLIRPGKPILYAKFPNKVKYFGLPGNPISCAVGFRFFIVPYLRKILGQEAEQALKANLIAPLRKKKGFRFFCKAFASLTSEGVLQVEILSGQQSFKIHPLLKANCWASLAPEQEQLDAGAKIDIYPLAPQRWNLGNAK